MRICFLVQSVYLPSSRTDIHRIWWKGVAWAKEREMQFWSRPKSRGRATKLDLTLQTFQDVTFVLGEVWAQICRESWKSAWKKNNQCRNMMIPYPDICKSATILYHSRMDCWPSSEVCASRGPFSFTLCFTLLDFFALHDKKPALAPASPPWRDPYD